MKQNILQEKIDYLLSVGENVLNTKFKSEWGHYVEHIRYTEFRSSALSFIANLYGKDHSYYTEFITEVNASRPSEVEAGIGILRSIKNEIEKGWLASFKQIVTAEVFSDFLEMGKYLLDEKYKDPAAIVIGSVLEEHLRQLCNAHGVDTMFTKGTDIIPKKADLLNADLIKAGVYNALRQKSVTAWLDLRNKAAHGKYTEYSIEQVGHMYMGVADFVASVS